MVSCFKQSSLFKWGMLLVGAVCAGLIYFNMLQDQHTVVRIIYGVLVLAISLIIGHLMASRYAATSHNRLLQALYRALDPARFIASYAPLPGRCRKDSPEYFMTSNYLACGYAADGDLQKAISILSPLRPQDLNYHQLATTALTFNNLCQFHLWDGNLEAAKEQYILLDALAEETKKRLPSVSKGLTYNLRLYDQYFSYLEGGPVDADYLREEIDFSANQLHRSNVELLLGKALLQSGNTAEAKEILSRLAHAHPNLHAGQEAAKLIDGDRV